MTQLLSLFDYLHYPAGQVLGAEVAKYAKQKGATISTRQVTNKKYTGPVNLYTPDLLESFFTEEKYQELITEDKHNYIKKILKKHENVVPKSNNELPF
jgi:hypothetical protein